MSNRLTADAQRLRAGGRLRPSSCAASTSLSPSWLDATFLHNKSDVLLLPFHNLSGLDSSFFLVPCRLPGIIHLCKLSGLRFMIYALISELLVPANSIVEARSSIQALVISFWFPSGRRRIRPSTDHTPSTPSNPYTSSGPHTLHPLLLTHCHTLGTPLSAPHHDSPLHHL